MRRAFSLLCVFLVLLMFLNACGTSNPTSLSLITPTVTVLTNEYSDSVKEQFNIFKGNECASQKSEDINKLPQEVQNAMKVQIFLDIKDNFGNSPSMNGEQLPYLFGHGGVVSFNGKRYLVTSFKMLELIQNVVTSLKESDDKKPKDLRSFGNLKISLNIKTPIEVISLPFSMDPKYPDWQSPKNTTTESDKLALYELSNSQLPSIPGVKIPAQGFFNDVSDKKLFCEGSLSLIGITGSNEIIPHGYNGTIGNSFFNKYGKFSPNNFAFRELVPSSSMANKSGGLIVVKDLEGEFAALGVASTLVPTEYIQPSFPYSFRNQPLLYLTLGSLK